MNKDEIICCHMAFRGEDEYLPERNTLLEVTDVQSDGTIEIAFTEKGQKETRHYIRFYLSDLISVAIKFGKTS